MNANSTTFSHHHPVIQLKRGTIKQLEDPYKDAIVGLQKEYCSEDTFKIIQSY